jgi:hypothetical protein
VKWLLLTSILLLAFPVLAGASTSRLAGMGVQGDYVKDYTNVFTYVSNLCCVGNLVYGELGVATDYDENYSEYYNTEDRAVGAILGNLWDGRFGTIGFHMREYSPALGTGSQPYVAYEGYLDEFILGTGFETFYPYIDPNVPDYTGYTPYWAGYGLEAFDLMWAKKFGSMSVGLRFNRSYYKWEDDNETYEGYAWDDRNILGFGGGLGFEISPTLATELGFLYQSRTYKFNYSDGSVEENDGGGSYLLAGRLLWQWQPNVLVVPVLRYYSFDESAKYTPEGGTADKYEATLKGWQMGVAGNWTLNQNDLFVAGISFAQNKYTNDYYEYEDTENLMPVMFASLETKVNSWMTLRFGGRKGVFYSTKYEDTAEGSDYEQTENWSPFQFFLGAGVKLGTLQFDGVLAQDFFHNPASYITADQNYYAPLFPKVTATYTF